MGEGGADRAALLGWRPSPSPNTICGTSKGAERVEETSSPQNWIGKGGVASRHSGVLASHCSPSMEDVRATSRHVEQPGFRSTVTYPLARQNDRCCEEFYSCEGSEPEGRPNGSAGTNAVEQKPPCLPGNGRASVTLRHRPEEDAASTACSCPTNRESEGAGENPDRRHVVVVNNDEREREAISRHTSEGSGKCDSIEVGLSPAVLAPGEAGFLKGDPQDCREEKLEGEGCSNNPWNGNIGAGEVCRGAPLSLEQGGSQALTSPALSCAIGTMMDTNVETQQPLTEEKAAPADDSRRDGEKRTKIPTFVRKKLDNAANIVAEVGVTACMTHYPLSTISPCFLSIVAGFIQRKKSVVKDQHLTNTGDSS